MSLFIVIIAIANVLIILLNGFFALPRLDLNWGLLVLASLGLTVAEVAIDGLFAYVVRRLPEKHFSADKKVFDVSKGEIKFWEFFGVRSWKDKVLELGVFTNFSKREVAQPDNPDYVKRFLLESNYGVVIHILGVIFGFAVVLFMKWNCLTITLPIALTNALLNLMSLGALRFNTPRLQVALKRALRKQRNEAATKTAQTV